jgi:hypothetical protein
MAVFPRPVHVGEIVTDLAGNALRYSPAAPPPLLTAPQAARDAAGFPLPFLFPSASGRSLSRI